jgi:tetratricopeptide (TPR) repeat protein
VSPAGPGAARARRRRARASLVAGLAAFAVLAGATLLHRPRPRPYTPGTEAAASEEITRTLSRSLPEGAPAVHFSEAGEAAGIRFRHFHGRRSTQLPEDMGSGAAWGDYDGDGDPDLFLVNESGPLTDDAAAVAASPARAALYRNNGDGSFTDVTAAAGLAVTGCGMGAAWGDYDGDGDLDLVVSRFGTNLLFRNNGDGTFTDVSRETGVGLEEGFWTGVSWADYDRDGDPDLYVAGYVRYRYDAALSGRTSLQYRAVVPFTLNPSTYPPERNLLLRNDGGRFRDVAREAGVDNPTGRSLSASWCDFDGDGWPDLYVANDVSDNAMFRNRGDGRFEDVSHSAWVADYRGAMGLAIGDWDNDGDFDIFITHWLAQENALYDNQLGVVKATRGEPLHFMDQADMLGLGQIALDYVGWGTGFFDYDNDGRLDLLVVNGSTFQREDDPSRLIPMKNLLFWNAGRQKGFFEVGEAGGAPFAVENVGRGAAFADYDGDGDQDVVVTVNGGAARLLRNDGGDKGGWVRVILRGPEPGARRAGRFATSRFAIGARVTLTTGSLRQIREVGGGSSYLSQSPPGEVAFGIGAATGVDLLEVAWPDGTRQSLRDLPARATVRLVEGREPVIAASAGAAAALSGREAVVRFWRTYDEATASRLKRDFPGAARLYEEALHLDPRHEDSLYYLGQCLRQLSRYAEARRTFERLVSLNPESARGNLALGALLASPEAGAPLDLAEAERRLRRAHAINGEETAPLVRLGEIGIVRGDLDAAATWLEAAARTNPKSVEAAFLAGYLRWEKGDPEGARAFLLRAVRAGRGEAPVAGVLGEGDRRGAAAASAGPRPAPPLQAAMGETLFGRLADSLRGPRAPDPGAALRGAALDAAFSPVREAARRLRSRAGPRS